MNKEEKKLLQHQMAREINTASEALQHIGMLAHDLGWPKYKTEAFFTHSTILFHVMQGWQQRFKLRFEKEYPEFVLPENQLEIFEEE